LEDQMPRFFFDTKLHDSVFRDPEGAEFATDEEALRQALEDAAAYAADRLAHGSHLDEEMKLLRSELGETIAQFTLREALRRMSVERQDEEPVSRSV
jgi:hypothetical protein